MTSSILNNTTLEPPHDILEVCNIHFKETILLVIYVLIIIIGVAGNIAILYVFGYPNKQIQTPTELLILYLAVFDLLGSLFGPFIFIYWIATCNQRWDFGVVGCKVLPLFSRVFINISVGIILILAVDRYRAICTPFRGQIRRKYIHSTIVLTIILSVACEYYYIVSLTVTDGPGIYGCVVIPSDKGLYRKFTSVILLLRAFIFILTFTFTTLSIAYTLTKRDQFFVQSINPNKLEMKRVVRVIIVMEVVFLILVLPRDLLHATFSLSWLDGDGIPFTKKIINLNEFLKAFQTANCCANIFIYAKLHDRFRKRFIEALRHSIGGGGSKHNSTAAALLQYKRNAKSPMNLRRDDCKDEGVTTYTRQLLRKKEPTVKKYQRRLLKKSNEKSEPNKMSQISKASNRITEMSFVSYEIEDLSILDNKSTLSVEDMSNNIENDKLVPIQPKTYV